MITTTTARAAVQAANAAGKQVQVTYNDGTLRTGTARWQVPGDPQCTVLHLFGVTPTEGPYSASAGGSYWLAGSRTDSDFNGLRAGIFYSPSSLSVSGQTVTSRLAVSNPWTPTSLLVRLADITAIGTTPAGSPALLPALPSASPPVAAQTNDADLTLGTTVNERGNRIPDPGWGYGTGLE